MIPRQFELITILLTSKERYLLVADLAKTVNCSEKTIRNDLNYISNIFKQYSTIQLNRKPGLGIFLLGSEVERQELLLMLQKYRKKPENERIFDLTYELLTANEPLTLQYFSDKYFTNRTNIRKDLDVITKWLLTFDITLKSRQKIGIFIEGDESKKRSAIASLVSSTKNNKSSITQLFPSHDVNFIKSIVNRQHFSFTDETSDRLVIHMLIMVKRIKQRNPITLADPDNNIIEKPEYKQALQLTTDIEHYFALKIPTSEVTYLAWHLISGKRLEKGSENDPAIHRLVDELVSEMTVLTQMEFDTDETLHRGLYIHLQPVLSRLSYELPIKNPMLNEIKNMYPYMFSTVISALEKSAALFSVILLEDEVAYIVLHFQASVERSKQQKPVNLRAIVVCHLGIGMSQLLTSRIERQIAGIQIEHCISKSDIHTYTDKGYDLFISTVELPDFKAQHIVISPLFNLEDQERLNRYIKNTHTPEQNLQSFSTLRHFIDTECVSVQITLEHRYEVVEMLANSLYDKGLVHKEFIHDAILRERTSATSIGSAIAIPHGNPSGILQSSIAVATFENPIEWGVEKVSLVFLLAVVDEDPTITKKLFNELSFLAEQKELIEKLAKQNDARSFMDVLIQ